MAAADVKLMGYADKLSVTPGEKIRFMVSSEAPSYEAAIVRLTRPDHSKGPSYTEEVISTHIDGQYSGRKQPIHSGSYGIVRNPSSLGRVDSFTLQAWIYPTTPQKSDVQGLLTKWSEPQEAGYGLFIGEDGHLALWIGNGDGKVDKVRTPVTLRASSWYFVVCCYDVDQEKAILRQDRLEYEPSDESSAIVERSIEAQNVQNNDAPFLIAGSHRETDETGKEFVRGVYNGKIDSPCVFGRALNSSEIESLRHGAPPSNVSKDLIAAWDFAADDSSSRITDLSGHQLHGETVNMPARAMTGHNWAGGEINFRVVPEEYGAIHFHEDDIEDAGWEADFELTVPQLRSSVYAARLTSGDAEAYIPFYVRPKKGAPTAPVVFLAPTNTYIAYANESLHAEHDYTVFTDNPISLAPEDEYLAEHPELGMSLYDVHKDRSGSAYSSRLRPILNMDPKYKWYVNGPGPRHFSADLYLIDWLEEKGYQYDVITDEDLHLEGEELLAPYHVVLTGTHPEYWTTPMVAAIEQYLNAGGRLMYLGGNGFYWVTGMNPERPHLIEVRRGIAGTRAWESRPGETYLSTTGEPGGLWRYRGKAPQRLVGVGFTSQGWGGAEGYDRKSDSFDDRVAFIFEGIGEDEVIGDFGLLMGGAAGDELDRLDYDLGTPPHALWLATSSGRHSDYYQYTVEDILMSLPGQGGTENPSVRADMVYVETPSGGAVFSVGSINWCGSLSYNDYNNNVSLITDNVLREFASG